MSWLRRIADALSVGEAPPDFDPREHIDHVVMNCGLTNERPEDLNFFVAAYEARRLNYRDVPKFGTLLTPDEKEALGIAAEAIFAREFIATLNERGRSDPDAAARRIAQPASQRCRSALDLQKMKQSGIAFVLFHASSTAVGPCPHAATLERSRGPIDKAKLLPFDDCDRSDHCACRYQAWQDIADGLDDLMI
jgi:hypothetical protein